MLVSTIKIIISFKPFFKLPHENILHWKLIIFIINNYLVSTVFLLGTKYKCL